MRHQKLLSWVPWFILDCCISFVILAMFHADIPHSKFLNVSDPWITYRAKPELNLDTGELLSDPKNRPDLKDLIQCDDVTPFPRISQKYHFYILVNYIPATDKIRCYESVTLVTQGDFRQVYNLPEQVSRWQGPISVAIHAPDEEFMYTLRSIQYLRTCNENSSEKIRRLVTFHLFFEQGHVPSSVPAAGNWSQGLTVDCGSDPPWKDAPRRHTGSSLKSDSLPYPINVARNVAKDAAPTYFVFPVDFQLFPSPNFTHDFLDMIRRQPSLLSRSPPTVFVLAIFEIEKGYQLPNTKREVLDLLKKKKMVYFHKISCPRCAHQIPRAHEWENAEITPGLKVFYTTKRRKTSAWEPIHVGTKLDPPYDERQTWDGLKDKTTRMYGLCQLDYNMAILDNAFLVHEPGIKKGSHYSYQGRGTYMSKTKSLLKITKMEYDIIYGNKSYCFW